MAVEAGDDPALTDEVAVVGTRGPPFVVVEMVAWGFLETGGVARVVEDMRLEARGRAEGT